MNNEELEKNVNYVMAHLDEVLDSDMFDDIISYDVLSKVDGNLRKEINGLVNTINYYKKRNDYRNVSKYKEALKDVKSTLEKLNNYKSKYVGRLEELHEALTRSDKIRKKTLSETSSKPKSDKVTDTDLYTDYSELLKFNEPVVGDLFGSFLYDIRTSKFMDEYSSGLQYELPIEIEKLLKRTDTLSKEELLTLSVLTIDVSRNKIRSIGKDSVYASIEKDFLRRLIKIFEELKPVKYESIDEDTSAYYDILEELIDNDANYTYISKLMRDIPNFACARKDDKHFAFLLLDRFIENYKLKLVNQGLPYVEPDFYKELISLNFSLGPSFSEDEKLDFSLLLVTFKDYVISKNYNNSEKVFDDIDFIADSMDKIKIIEEKQDDKVLEELSSLKYRMADVSNFYVKNNYSVSSAFKFDNISNYAFSVDYSSDDNIILKIHILDTASFIKDDSLIYEEMKSKDLELPRFELNSFYPAMTFVYTIFSNNKISDVRVTSSVVNISEEYANQDLGNYMDNPRIKDLFSAFKRIKDYRNIDDIYYSQDGIKDFTDSILNKDITKSFVNNNMPFIYKAYLENGNDLVRINHNAVCDKLIDIPKKEAHRVFDILDEVYDSYYVPNGGKLELDSSKFLGLYLLTTIHRIQDGVYDITKVEEELSELLVTLNNREKYLPSSVLRNNERKVKRMVRIYKKNNKKDVV
ncbi:MAG TPA: hypothetical protein IAB38_02055 [Candidatus Onthousia excrementipullorum]|uniref:Uncharacterized protein n=1 Tax=Candidatus Onthousia excrementipullorum TaxID=2840884 RepID=A0A9D1J305_9FIRM|nr:hypothetical protein [Candidatus Onthousia excrementipullorum]